MTRWRAVLGALPAAFWCVLAGAGALLLAFLRGRAAARRDDAVEAQNQESRDRIDRMQQAAAAGDDDAAQREAFDGIKPRPALQPRRKLP